MECIILYSRYTKYLYPLECTSIYIVLQVHEVPVPPRVNSYILYSRYKKYAYPLECTPTHILYFTYTKYLYPLDCTAIYILCKRSTCIPWSVLLYILYFRYTKYLYPLDCTPIYILYSRYTKYLYPWIVLLYIYILYSRYTKYLYPLECKLNNLSNPNDLQSAIEGNKREGRTSSYGPYGMGLPFQNSPLPPSMGSMPPFSMMNTPPRSLHMNGNGRPMHPGE